MTAPDMCGDLGHCVGVAGFSASSRLGLRVCRISRRVCRIAALSLMGLSRQAFRSGPEMGWVGGVQDRERERERERLKQVPGLAATHPVSSRIALHLRNNNLDGDLRLLHPDFMAVRGKHDNNDVVGCLCMCIFGPGSVIEARELG